MRARADARALRRRAAREGQPRGGALLTGEDGPGGGGRAICRAGRRLVAVVTLGPDGALLRGASRADVPGVPRTRVDTTGAGDVVTGVLVAALATAGFEPPAVAGALPAAVEAAARATEGWGAVDALPPTWTAGCPLSGGSGSGRTAQRMRADPRPAARLLRPAAQRAPPRAARRAGADGPLAEHERPQPRRRLRAAARRGSRTGRRSRARRSRRSRRRSGPGGISKVKSRRIKAMLGVIEAETGGLDLELPRRRRRASEAIEFLERLPGRRAARRRPACCCSPTTGRSCRSTRTSTGSRRGSG